MRIFVIRRLALVIGAALVVLLLVSAPSLRAIVATTRARGAIVIDPGHGGIDGGAYIAGQVVEKDIVLDVALALRDALGDSSRKIRMTRDRDIDVSASGRRRKLDLASRLTLVRQAGGSMLVSVHANYCRDRRPRGPIVFYKPGSTASQRLAQCIHHALVPFEPQQSGPVPGAFYILRNSSVPAVLVEIGFISNEQERALLKTPDYRRRIADAIARGIRSYLGGVASGVVGGDAADGGVASGVASGGGAGGASPAAALPDTIPVYFPLRGGFSLARSVTVEASLPVMAPTAGTSGVELLARSVLARLLIGPEDGTQFAPAVPAGTTLAGVTFRDGLLTVDLSSDVAAITGAADEYLTVYALVDSLCGIPGVERVQLLVDGQRVETLAGHIDIERPLLPVYSAVSGRWR
ncbi:MAG: N-acetylmuramoyl-L-alanine amidase [Chloroflexota bacterium]